MLDFFKAIFSAILNIFKYIPNQFIHSKIFWYFCCLLLVVFAIISGLFVYFYP